MTMPPAFTRRFRDNATVLLLALFTIAIVGGVVFRVQYLRGEMLSRWGLSLQGGKVTTRATVDQWFEDRTADANALARGVAAHATIRPDEPRRAFANILAPVHARGKFLGLWILDSAGAVLASSTSESLRPEERAATRRAIETGRNALSDVMRLGDHAANVSIAAPVKQSGPTAPGVPTPATVLLRADVVAAFAPWAAGRPHAAHSLFATPVSEGTVVISACPERKIPVCISPPQPLVAGTPAALALAGVDTFGVFRDSDGSQLLASTALDTTLGWGIVRRVRYADALVPLHREYAIEGAFLAVLLALIGVGAFAANRDLRVRRLNEQREAAVRLAAVVDASSDGIVSLDGKFYVTMVNAGVERLLGYPRSELIGKPVSFLFSAEWHGPLGESLEALAQSSVAHAPPAETERWIARTSDGSLLPVDARVGRAQVKDTPLYVMGLRDVSERARTEYFLQGQRHVLELIAIGAPVAETMAVLLAVIEGEAPAMRCAVHELDEEHNVARLVSAPALSPELSSAIREVAVGHSSQTVGTAIRREEPVHTSDIATDALWDAWTDKVARFGVRAGWAIPLRAADGRVIGALSCLYDEARPATSREHELGRAAVHLASIALSAARDAAAVRASEASFRSFVENAPAAIFRETRDGELISVNPAMVALLGYSGAAELAMAAHTALLYQDPNDRVRLALTLDKTDVIRGHEVLWRRADQSCVSVRLSARAYRDDRGDVWMWEGYAEDVTSLRAAEGALRRNERLAAVGQLISGVAHELNNPLSSIMHFAEDLLQDERSADDAEALGVIRDQARRSRAIVRDLLSFVKQRQANAEPLSLEAVVAATARAMRPELAGSGVRLHLSESGAADLVLADRAGLEQIVTNLISNAAHAAGRDGHVWVQTGDASGGCTLVVEDSGPGIPSDILPHIFDPFFTTKLTGEGTGLGLCVTLGIVELFGGRINVDSRSAGTGSRFTVFLPCMEGGAMIAFNARTAAAAATTAAVHSAQGLPSPSVAGARDVAPAAAKRTALIIDDEPSIRAALRRYFARRGWTVEEAGDGAAGLALLERHGNDFGIVISDLRMPGLSGIELHDRLLREHPALLHHFIFSTGDVASAEAARFLRRTECPVLQKPFELRMLDEIIDVVTGGTPAERVIA